MRTALKIKRQAKTARQAKGATGKMRAPGRKNMRAADREKVILESAIRFFAEHGFEGQTRELAKRIGITHSAIYRHFPSKEALYDERFVTFGEDDVYEQSDAAGFIRLFGLAQRVRALKDLEAAGDAKAAMARTVASTKPDEIVAGV